MFGGLYKSVSILALCAATGLAFGGSLSPAKAADLGGDCCADLEERVAELEATTVRKGSKVVSLTLSGQVNRGVLWYDDGSMTGFRVADSVQSTSRFRLQGEAKIAPGWSAGYYMEFEFVSTGSFGTDQIDSRRAFPTIDGTISQAMGVQNSGQGNSPFSIGIRQSHWYLKNDQLGTLSVGRLNSATKDMPGIELGNIAILANSDLRIIGGEMFLRRSGTSGREGLCANGLGCTSTLRWTALSGGLGDNFRFDGVRWTGFSELGYGLGGPWPFPTDNSEALCVRAGTGAVAVNPLNNFTHEWNGSGWDDLAGGPDQVYQYAEDSRGRLWSTWHYGGLGVHENGGYTYVSFGDWFGTVQRDPTRDGTVWADLGWEIVRTDGVYRSSRGIADFPELDPNADRFTGLAVGPGGEAWFGSSVHNGTGDPAGALYRLDAATGQQTLWRSEDGWPFPGYSVSPKAVTPDGRVWMVYEGGVFPNPIRGLCWFDGTAVGMFPAPAGGEPQWGGLPHAAIKDLEVKVVPGGYELWMSCLSRGIAVLSVTTAPCRADFNGDGFIDFFDYDDFVQCFEASVCPEGRTADVNGDGFVDFFDYDDFVAAFEIGC